MKADFSYWERDVFNQTWDVCIVGSGITGISTGISILEKSPGSKVLVVDRWFLPLGASTRNAGFACFGSPSEILEDIQIMGPEAALDLVVQRWNGLKILKDRLAHADIGYAAFGGYELYHANGFEQVADQLSDLDLQLKQRLGLTDVFQPVRVPEGIEGFSHAVYNPNEGQLHPVKMMEALRHQFIHLGGEMITGIEIDQVEEDNHTGVLLSLHAIPLRARQIVITTNGFASQLLPDLDVHGARNHVVVTDPVPGLTWQGTFHFDRGYYYFRNIGKRILLGGARNLDPETERTSSFGENQAIVQHLEEFLYRHLVQDRKIKITDRWSGIIGVGEQKTPILQRISPHIVAGVRLSGMGIALASLMGEQLADMVIKQEGHD